CLISAASISESHTARLRTTLGSPSYLVIFMVLVTAGSARCSVFSGLTTSTTGTVASSGSSRTSITRAGWSTTQRVTVSYTAGSYSTLVVSGCTSTFTVTVSSTAGISLAQNAIAPVFA